jgi:cob(I)alamin adenosyltransferase
MGLVHVYTGNGGGKTTSALGLAMRAVGHNQKVIVIQFLKGRKDIGEYKIQKKLAPYYEVYQFGTKEFIDPKKPKPKDLELARKGLEFAREALKRKPNLLILDEINYAMAWNLLKVEDVLDLLKDIPKKTNVILTGRYAPDEIINRADIVTTVEDIKGMKKRTPAKKGYEY